jgi:ribosome-associated translation inhibitor RaiA
MQIQVNTDRNIDADETLSAEVSRTVEGALGRFSDDITRVEVHLSDENSNKKARGEDDMRCLMEARLEGREPIAVTHRAATSGQAVAGAAEKLSRSIASSVGRLRDQQRSAAPPSGRTDPTDEP